MKTEPHPIIAALIAHITAELTPVDVEAAYRASLDDAYPEVEVAGLTFSPSRIIEELDPTAFRCGCADFSDSEPWTEIAGDYYRDDELDEAKAAFVEEREGELRELERQEGAIDFGDKDAARDIASDILAKQAEIDALEAHSF